MLGVRRGSGCLNNLKLEGYDMGFLYDIQVVNKRQKSNFEIVVCCELCI